MLTVRFYNFTKKTNSTKLPTGGTAFQCLLNTPSGVVNPSLTISGITSPTYNYCYIPDFGRYYWIREWSWNLGDWIASCEVDVLASYKSQIGASTQYVLRSESDYDGRIIDTFYPGTANLLRVSASTDSPFVSSADSGSYVLGVINKSNAYLKQGAVSYYTMSKDQLTAFMQKILSPGSYGEEIDKQLFNPLQYIASCMWFPIAAGPATLNSIEFGWWTMSNVDASNTLPNYGNSGSLRVQKHPQAPDRGVYMNLEPYSQYTFDWRPFGTIPIDSGLLLDAETLSYTMNLDMISGVATIDLFTGSGASYYHIAQAESQIGVPVQLSQIYVDKIAQTQAVVGGVSSILSGDVTGVISSVVSGIADYARASAPQLHSTGHNGSRALYVNTTASGSVDNKPRLQSRQVITAEQNNNTWGKPLCSNKKISDLSGFIMCAEVELSIGGTSEESDQIKTFMEGGFHYE